MLVPRRGFSIQELLVSITVIAILMALILPAVQQARESARRTQCVSNLRQLGIAMHSYADVYQFVPPGNTNGYSAFVLLLPFLEQSSLYAEFDLASLAQDSSNSRFHRTPLAILNCPSDPGNKGSIAQNNYVANAGSGLHESGQFRGVFTIPALGGQRGGGWIRFDSITDGLSNTAGFAEILVSDGSRHNLRIVGSVKPAFRDSGQSAEFTQKCDSPETLTRRVSTGDRGFPWIDGNHPTTLYNHVAPPNHRACTNDGSVPDGSFPVSSTHGLTANVCLVDGSVRGISSHIDQKTWQAIGTRAGAEVVSEF
ncbi:MAG: DUF1559 domain-containing protein [Planctomycetaceae bacterium]|nr:DUF1559 domain-containing protein [Planctomycetaceae bacterium]